MEKKAKLWLSIIVLLLAAIAGAALGLATAGHERPIKGSGLSNREVEELERSLAAASERCSGTLSETRGTARELADGLEAIGETAAGTDRCLEELASLIAELQRRSGEESP